MATSLKWECTNNKAEWEAFITGLRAALNTPARNLTIYSDSQLVINQLNGSFETKDERMEQYKIMAKDLMSKFAKVTPVKIERENNAEADALSRATISEVIDKGIISECQDRPSIDQAHIDCMEIDIVEGWMKPIKDFMEHHTVPEDPLEAQKLRRRAGSYTMIRDKLYRRSYSQPLLKCVTEEEGKTILAEIHGGICGAHPAASSLAHLAMRQGYFWPTMKTDSENMVQKCRGCQIHARIPRLPTTTLFSILAPWPFYMWGMDLVGPLPNAKGGMKYLLVVIDYFTKWIEVTTLRTMQTKPIIRFLEENLICRFGLPHVFISDNGTQFTSNAFKTWCAEKKIEQRFTSVAHPQSNGQTEVTNRTLLEGLKARIADSRTLWLENLPNIVWAHRTTPRAGTNETPFSLCYRVEAVVPAEILLPSFRIEHFNEESNEESLRGHLDLLEEGRERAHIRNAHYKSRIANQYNKRVRPRSFAVGQYVMRKQETSKPDEMGKLAPNWEGPYRVKAVSDRGSYKLEDIKTGEEIPRMWHIGNLRRFYF